MREEIGNPTSGESLEIGRLLGQNQAFGLIAGRCSAAQAATIRRLRQDKLYKALTPDWSEFCATHLKMARRSADQIIHLLDEFGPGYFEMAQLTRISPETYRAIQPAIQDGALHHNGEALALIEANSQQVAAAVAEMRRERAAPPPSVPDRLQALERRCDAVLEEFRRISDEERGGRYHLQLAAVLGKVRSALGRIHLENGPY